MKSTKTTRGRKRRTVKRVINKEQRIPGTPRPVDIHVGSRVRLRRTLMGFSQERLGDAVGLTFQQIQKYERGANRIGASRLFEFSKILDVPVSFFFDDMSSEVKTMAAKRVTGFQDQSQRKFEADPLARRETLELVRAYYRIADPRVRKSLFDLAKSLAKSGDDE
ncbi:MAG: helix-turn-helix transcriptional regulator [Rhodospirillales bacterium]